MDAYPARAPEPETLVVPILLVGVTSSVKKVFGANAAIARTGTGTYTITFTESPGVFLGAPYGLHATTQSALAGFTVVGSWSASTLVYTIVVYNASAAAADLAALQWVSLAMTFGSALAAI